MLSERRPAVRKKEDGPLAIRGQNEAETRSRTATQDDASGGGRVGRGRNVVVRTVGSWAAAVIAAMVILG